MAEPNKKQTESLDSHSVVELRVHGVSNTPPEDILERAPDDPLDVTVEDLVPVAGDDDTRIFRLTDELSTTRKIRAYSWGNLTHGRNRAAKDLQRALWMVFLPFAFANVALWTGPDGPEPDANASSTGGWRNMILRLFALSLTVTLALTAVGVTLDQIVWQWTTADPPQEPCECGADNAAQVSWLAFLRTDTYLNQTAGVAIGAGAAILVLLIVWAIARRSFQYEAQRVEVTAELGPEATIEHPMESEWFWRGRRQAAYLSWLHLSAAIAAILLLTLISVDDVSPGWWEWTRLALTVLAGGSLFASGALLWSENATTRSDQNEPVFARMLDPRMRKVFGLPLAKYLGVATLAIAVATLTLLGVFSRTLDLRGSLPHYADTLLWLSVLQVVALAVIWSFRSEANATSGMPDEHPLKLAWWGRGPGVLATAGWLLAILYSAATLAYAADFLNGSGDPFGEDDSIVVPFTLQVAAAWVAPLVVLIVIGALVEVWRINKSGKALVDAVQKAREYKPRTDSRRREKRASEVATAWAIHDYLETRLIDRLGVGAAWLFAITALVTVATAIEHLWPDAFDLNDFPGIGSQLDQAATAAPGVGSRVLLVLGLALVATAVQVYRGGIARRVLGIVWDVATFWPRVCHPWAPPCYAESCVPQLATYIGNRDLAPGPGPGFILAGHSQGSVISAATLWQLPPEHRERCAFLTFGTQLRGFYGRAFPAYFGPPKLQLLATQLGGSPTGNGARWISLWRHSDPIGYPVGGVDQPVVDPHKLTPTSDDYVDPPMHGHSGYWLDPRFDAAAQSLADRLVPPTTP